MTEHEKIQVPTALQNLAAVAKAYKGDLADHMKLQASLAALDELWAEKQARDTADALAKEKLEKKNAAAKPKVPTAAPVTTEPVKRAPRKGAETKQPAKPEEAVQ